MGIKNLSHASVVQTTAFVTQELDLGSIMDKQTAIIIPARYGSSRLEGKPLLKAGGKYIIQWVWEKAIKCKESTE